MHDAEVTLTAHLMLKNSLQRLRVLQHLFSSYVASLINREDGFGKPEFIAAKMLCLRRQCQQLEAKSELFPKRAWIS